MKSQIAFTKPSFTKEEREELRQQKQNERQRRELEYAHLALAKEYTTVPRWRFVHRMRLMRAIRRTAKSLASI